MFPLLSVLPTLAPFANSDAPWRGVMFSSCSYTFTSTVTPRTGEAQRSVRRRTHATQVPVLCIF
ncbi:MAG: hypothetical protein A4E40_00759 [Methanoregulaceae archaeon PtaU1.Bin059]|nr:MAG: hypothetical protein A4E40_00759 [Methanoregulaceae archaeon PtaU1.Bin059]